MRKIIFLIAASGALGLNSPAVMAQTSQPQQQPKSFKGKLRRNVTARYLLFLPKDYHPRSGNKWPLILFLHGAGERGTNLSKVTVHGPPKVVKEKPDLPFIVVSPQCPGGQRWDVELLVALLDDVVAKYKVDESRVYLTGLSMGGYGAWDLGLTYPERFAALAPICGGGDPIALLLADPKKVPALRSLPVWAFHGAKDPVVPLSESERMIETLKKFGSKEVELTVYPEADHDSWTETYHNPKLYEWFLAHRRRSAGH